MKILETNGLWVGVGISVDELYIVYLVYRIVKSRELGRKAESSSEMGIAWCPGSCPLFGQSPGLRNAFPEIPVLQTEQFGVRCCACNRLLPDDSASFKVWS